MSVLNAHTLTDKSPHTFYNFIWGKANFGHYENYKTNACVCKLNTGNADCQRRSYMQSTKLPRLGTTNSDPVANHGKLEPIQRLYATMPIMKNFNIFLLQFWMSTPSEQEVSRSLLILCKISLLATRESKRSHNMI